MACTGQDHDIELGPSDKSCPRAQNGFWHHPSCACTCAIKLPDQHPPPAHLPDERLPQYKPISSPTTSLMPEKLRRTLPRKRYSRLMRNVRWTWLSVYHRLHLIVLVPNILAIATLGAQHKLWAFPPSGISLAIALNVTATILIRQELVINLLFSLVGKCPHWVPLRLRRVAAKIYHLGGVHSGAGIAATVWYSLLNAVILKGYLQAEVAIRGELAVVIITFVINVLFLSIVVIAMPQVRKHFHNTFEAVHRFAGWAAVALFWVQFCLVADITRKSITPPPTLAAAIYTNPIFYLLLTITISLILPWLRLRKVPVVVEELSDHAVRLHFSYTKLPLCVAPRISDSPLKEWHAFAGIPEKDGAGFSIIISKAGDWTSRIIKSPPSRLWVRGIPAKGVLHVAPIFRSLVLVATGSGIGPILSLLTARGIHFRILWSTKDPVKTYRQGITNEVLTADPNAVIVNTGIHGRPDLVQESLTLYKVSHAEAVFVISNPQVTRKVVFSLESRGIPAFAPIFDS